MINIRKKPCDRCGTSPWVLRWESTWPTGHLEEAVFFFQIPSFQVGTEWGGGEGALETFQPGRGCFIHIQSFKLGHLEVGFFFMFPILKQGKSNQQQIFIFRDPGSNPKGNKQDQPFLHYDKVPANTVLIHVCPPPPHTHKRNIFNRRTSLKGLNHMPSMGIFH